VKYDFESVAICDDVEKVIPRLLFALAVIFCLVFVISVVSAILALLVLRAERNKRGYIGVSDKLSFSLLIEIILKPLILVCLNN